MVVGSQPASLARVLVVALSVAAALSLLAAPASAADQWTTPHPGVQRLARTTSRPQRVNVLKIDLCADGIGLRATRTGERRRTTSSFASAVNAVAAVNGDFFSYDDYHTSGLAVGNGTAWTDTADSNSSGLIAFGDDRVELFNPRGVVNPEAWMKQVVSGHPGLVDDGASVASDTSDFCSTRHPRTALGLSKDGRTLILAVVDGRSSASVGMRCTELAALMVEMGAHRAINLDGGGSSTMWVRGSGVVNRPSDGAERTVGNHLAILRAASVEPGSCDRSLEASTTHAAALQATTSTDIDGDGIADVCGRGADGLECAFSRASGGFGPVLTGPGLRDNNGWKDASNWATVQLGDVDGDGRADLCARANAGMRCWPSLGDGFGPSFVGPEWSDDLGWDKAPYYGTIRLADVDADGRDDLCARAADGFRCHLSTADGFGPARPLDNLADRSGWAAPRYYGTIRMGDLDGDGRADLCARAAAGVRCWRSTDAGWSAPIDGPAWSDAAGWGAVRYWSTIRLTDVDGDGRADLCARAATGLQCHLSTGDGFGPAIIGPAWSDDSGWGDYGNLSTILFGDLDGDGDQDVCARANAGVNCALFADGAFTRSNRALDDLSDGVGWDRLRFYSTLHLVDVTGDGKADLCARAAARLRCWPSAGTAFGAPIDGPLWSEEQGWGAPDRFSTIRIHAPRCRTAELCNGRDDTCDGAVDEGCEATDPDAGDVDAGGFGVDPADAGGPAPDADPEDADDLNPASDLGVPDNAADAQDGSAGPARTGTYAEGCATSPTRRGPSRDGILVVLAIWLAMTLLRRV